MSLLATMCRYGDREVQLDPMIRTIVGTSDNCDVQLTGVDRGGDWARLQVVGGWRIRPLGNTEVAVGAGPWQSGSAAIDATVPVVVRLRREDNEHHLHFRSASRSNVTQPVNECISSSAPSPSSAPIRPTIAHGPLPPATRAKWSAGASTIGRNGGGADIQLSGADVANMHARFDLKSDGSVVIHDLSKGLGVFVDGQALGSARLVIGETFVIGHHQLVIGPYGPTVQSVRRTRVLTCHKLRVIYSRKDQPSLNDISFTLEENGFLTVIGPSGAGKSTLCHAILGEVSGVTGGMDFAGQSFTTRGLPSSLVSFVPQADSLPTNLTVTQTLRVATDLRLASDLSAQEVSREVASVMELLELADYAHRDIAELSGGTRKRLSVAMELLSNPILLILDEPTSGLDEGLDRRLMRVLADLAQRGTAILVVTHSMVNLGESRQILAINSKGTTGYLGAPGAMLEAFDVNSFADLMDDLRAGASFKVKPATDTATPKTIDATVGTKSILRSQTPVLARRELQRLRPRRRPEPGGFKRTLTELKRTWAKPVLYLLLAPVLVALLGVKAGPDGLLRSSSGPNDGLATVLSVLTITSAFLATALTSGSIVGDYSLIARESRWGIRPRSVVLSRFWVFGTLGAIQGAFAGVAFLILRPGPIAIDSIPGWLLMVISLSLLNVAGVALGLAVSAMSRAVEHAVFALMALSVSQVVLSGLLIPLGDADGAGDSILAGLSWLMPTRWAVAALGSGIDINKVRGIRPDLLWSHDLPHVVGAWLILVVLTFLLLVASSWILSKRLHRRL